MHILKQHLIGEPEMPSEMREKYQIKKLQPSSNTVKMHYIYTFRKMKSMMIKTKKSDVKSLFPQIFAYACELFCFSTKWFSGVYVWMKLTFSMADYTEDCWIEGNGSSLKAISIRSYGHNVYYLKLLVFEDFRKKLPIFPLWSRFKRRGK